MSVNWKEGIKRVHYFVLGLLWLFGAVAIAVDGLRTLPTTLLILTILTGCYIGLALALSWILRGFIGKAE